MITIDVSTVWYELPADGAAAESQILAMLRSPGETWIKAYNFSLKALFDEIRAASKAGIVGHALLDHTQSTTPSEHLELIQLANDCPNWDFTITTAGSQSASTGQIEHDKALVVAPTNPGAQHACWSGSVNLSDSGFRQGNLACYFESDDWAAAFIAEFNEHKAWALANEARWQLPKADMVIDGA